MFFLLCNSTCSSFGRFYNKICLQFNIKLRSYNWPNWVTFFFSSESNLCRLWYHCGGHFSIKLIANDLKPVNDAIVNTLNSITSDAFNPKIIKCKRIQLNVVHVKRFKLFFIYVNKLKKMCLTETKLLDFSSFETVLRYILFNSVLNDVVTVAHIFIST